VAKNVFNFFVKNKDFIGNTIGAFMIVKKWLISILFTLLSCQLLSAGTTGKIKGKVIEKDSGQPVIGANVILEGTTKGAAADMDGNYFIINVPPGKYNIVVTAIGYQKIKITGAQVFTDRTTNQDFELSSEVLQGDEVVITAVRPIIEKDRTNTSAYVNSDQIDALPVQEVEDLIQLQTGITRDASGRFHMRGGRAGEIAYLVDGIPVTNQFSGGSLIEIENSWIQELQVISGTFNAEYGQAQSGVVNVVSKEGKEKFSGNATVWIGDYLSSHSDIFMNINRLNLGESNLQFDLSGPLNILPKGTFFFNVRAYDREGYLYGQRQTRIEDTWQIQSYYHEAQKNPTDEERLVGIAIPDSLQTGDGSYVPMNPSTKYSAYGNISFWPVNSIKFSYSLFLNRQKWNSYTDSRRYSPDAIPDKSRTGFDHILHLTHTLSDRTFHKLGFSYSIKKDESYLFEDQLDSRYQGSELGLNGFYFGGTADSRSFTKNKVLLAKWDITSQVGQLNLVKAGLEFKYHEIERRSLSTISRSAVYLPPNLEVPAENTAGNNAYLQRPIEAAVYMQDKMEFDEMIVNAGIRFDYWHARANVLQDLQAETDPSNGIRLNSPLTKSDPHYQLSPRLGLAYPISNKGVVHVSYGHFFQIPRFSYIFANSEFEVELGDLETIMGNANLKPEKNIAYELGFQQELAEDWGLQVTVYYKDIKNLLGQEIITTRDKKIYARYINRDYGNVKGIIVSIEKRHSNLFAGSIDYTYQIARGNASDPNSVFSDFQSHPPKESEKQILPLDWDQRHTLNPTMMIGQPGNWNIGIIGRFETGQPYTPSNPGSALTTQFENSDRKPISYNIDLNIYKVIKMFGNRYRLFCKVYNVLDRLNERRVYSSTGTAEFPYRSNAEWEILRRNPNFTPQEIDLRPDFYTQPRRIIFGLSVKF